MTIKQKIYVYLGLIMLLIAVLILWAVFAYNGKTDVGTLIAQLGGLVTIIVAAISAVGGFHSGQSGASPLLAGVSLASADIASAPKPTAQEKAQVPIAPAAGAQQ